MPLSSKEQLDVMPTIEIDEVPNFKKSLICSGKCLFEWGTFLLLQNNMKPKPSNPEHIRMRSEKNIVDHMVVTYCRGHHGTHGELCTGCAQFRDYAFLRLDRCRFQEKKSTCGKCIIHCYKPDVKVEVKKAMRYSGPPLLRHPSLAMYHAWDGRQTPHLDKIA